MKNISLYKKMFLSMLSFSVLICVLAYLMYSSQSINIHFVKQELKGLEYQKPLQDLFRVVSLHRILSSFHSSNSASQLLDLKNEGDEIIQKLRYVDNQYGEDLEFTDLGLKKRQRESFNVLTLENHWNEFKKNSTDEKHIQIISHIRTMITHMGDTSNLILDPSRKLSQASLDLSGSTTVAASSLQESVASIEELSSMVSQNAKNTKNVSEFSEQADTYAESASKQVKSLIQCMDKVTQGSQKIEDIISVIDDIAYQTNLLALNAAVEAARAGEQGRGFAVVTESVRSLVLKSSDSAKQISELIKSNGESVKVGNSMAIQSGDSIESIVKVIKNVTNLNKEIAKASDEQSLGLNQITIALNSLDAATQKNASASSEVAEFADFLYKESAILGQHVATLKTIVEGKKD